MSLEYNTINLGAVLEAVRNLPSGVTVQRASGTFTTDANGEATVNCGFQPDLVYIKGETDTNEYGTFNYGYAAAFYEDGRSGNLCSATFNDNGSMLLSEAVFEQKSNGFYIFMQYLTYGFDYELLPNTSFNYVAV